MRTGQLAGPLALLAALVLLGAAAPSALAGWGNPFRIAQPFSLDIVSPALAFSPNGSAVVVFGLQDADSPQTASAYAAWRGAGGGLSAPRTIPGALQPFGVTFDGGTAVLLTGGAPNGQGCCGSVGVVRMTASGAFRSGQTLLGSIAGQPTGQLVSSGGHVLAAIATARGVWVSQSGRGGRFGSAHRLTAGNAAPEAVAAGAQPKGGGTVVFTDTKPRTHGSGPTAIFVASGSGKGAPRRARTAVTLSGGRHPVDLAVSVSSKVTTIAWTEESFDRHGNEVSDVAVMDLTPHPSVRRFAARGTVASGLTLAGDPGGDVLLAWKTCTFSGACAVRAAVRTARHGFGSAGRLDAMDATESPVAVLAPNGNGLLGWIHSGHVVAAALRHGGLQRNTVVSHTSFAADLALGFGPRPTALAAWSQGTLSPEVVGAAYRP